MKISIWFTSAIAHTFILAAVFVSSSPGQVQAPQPRNPPVMMANGINKIPAGTQVAAVNPPVRPRSVPYNAMLPPLEFDHPYRGRLFVERYATVKDTQAQCLERGGGGKPLACSRRFAGNICSVILPTDAAIRGEGADPEVLWRHEIGHCNGWLADHAGNRLVGAPPLEAPDLVIAAGWFNPTIPGTTYTTRPAAPPAWWEKPQQPDPSRWWETPPLSSPSANDAQPPTARVRGSNGDSVCLAVIDPPAEVTKDREFTADSWLILREAPDTKSKAVVKLGNKEKLEADEIRDDWTHVSNVIRLSEADAAPNQKLVQGWVRSKYLVERQCYDDPANGPLPPPENTREPPAKYDHPFNGVMRVDHDVAACIKMRPLVPGEIRLGCTDRRSKTADAKDLCVVHMLPDKELKRYGFSPERLLRHHIGHCNGWPENHSNPSSEPPPAKYDHPFDGVVRVDRDMHDCDEDMGPNKARLGCTTGRVAYYDAKGIDDTKSLCVIHMLPDKELRARGFTSEMILRHEIGHCNGWPEDHPAAGDEQQGEGQRNEFGHIAAAQAKEIPAQYRGDWCMINDQSESRWLMKPCSNSPGLFGMSFSRESFGTEHSNCKLLAITSVPGGHKVRALCDSHAIDQPPEGPPELVLEHWRLSPNGRRLEVHTD